MPNIEQVNIDTTIDYSSDKPELQEAFKNLGVHTKDTIKSEVDVNNEIIDGGKLAEIQYRCDVCAEMPNDILARFFEDNLQVV